jgi:hypothetical protein
MILQILNPLRSLLTKSLDSGTISSRGRIARVFEMNPAEPVPWSPANAALLQCSGYMGASELAGGKDTVKRLRYDE